MLDYLAYSTFDKLDGFFLGLYILTYHYNIYFAILAGCILPSVFLDKPDREKEDNLFFHRATIFVSFVLLFIGTFSTLAVPYFSNLYSNWHIGVVNTFRYYNHVPGLLVATFIASAIHVTVRRWLSPKVDSFKHSVTHKTSLARNERTDVRDIRKFLPDTVKYNPEDYIDVKNKGVFIGLDEQLAPQYIPLDDWQKQHADIIGTTGAGKGVASGILLYQSILAGEGVFVLDPKNDEWAPHLFRYACEQAGVPFYLIDLNNDNYQFNLIKDINAWQLEELFVAGFSLGEQGTNADFYKIADRRMARDLSKFYDKFKTISELFDSPLVKNAQSKTVNGEDVWKTVEELAPGFHGKLEEISLLKSINARNGMDLQSIFDEGGCCYVIGSMRNQKVITAQRMLLIRLFQLAEMRDRVASKPRPIAIFLDELKYHLSKPALEGLGAARDKGVHIIMAHQSIADLRDCPADLNGDSVVGAVVENAKFKLVYKLQDPETAEWIAKMTGIILVDDESRKIERSAVLTESVDGDRTIRQAERYLVDTNMLQNLPPFVCFVFTTSLTKPSLISPLIVQKKELKVSVSIETDDVQLADSDVSEEESKDPTSEAKDNKEKNKKAKKKQATPSKTSGNEEAVNPPPPDISNELEFESESGPDNIDTEESRSFT